MFSGLIISVINRQRLGVAALERAASGWVALERAD